LAEAVPGLPSAADLDFSSWTLAANADQAVVQDDEVKVIGPLRLDIPRFNAFLNDADEDSRRLATVLAEWALEPSHPMPSEASDRATALAQGAAQVGHQALAGVAGALAQALLGAGAAGSFAAVGQLAVEDAASRLLEAAEEIRRLLHQFAAGFLTEPSPQVLERLADIGSVALAPIGPTGLRYLQGVAQAQTSAAQALQRLEACRPSSLAGLHSGAEADAVFEAAWVQAAQDLHEAQRLVGTVLAGLGNPPR
jgi:chemosensory pili system protein ChpA (sensor histidine kinase/response regulator)